MNPDKMDSMVYSEKYGTSVPYSSRGFGGKGLDGVVLLTATGLMGAVVNNGCEDPVKPQPLITSEKMTALRNHILFADMAYSSGKKEEALNNACLCVKSLKCLVSDGDVHVVTCNESMKQPVLVNKIKVSLNGSRDRVEVQASAAQSLFLSNLLGTINLLESWLI